MFSFIKSILDKLNINFNINKKGHKATLKDSTKSQVLQVGGDIHYAPEKKSEKSYDIKVKVQSLKKCLNETGSCGQFTVVDTLPDGYRLRLDFINRGTDNTIEDLLLFINDKEYKPNNFKPVELSRAKITTKTFYFSEDINQIVDSGKFSIKAKDIYDNEFSVSGDFPVE